MNDELSTCTVPAPPSCPLGPLRLVASPTALVELTFAEHRGARPLPARAVAAADHPVLGRAARELERWLAGDLRAFEVPLAPRGTAFQRAVWDALRAIPYGATRSYSELAAALGRPSATRAVASANRMNPLSIVVPCHRVIGRDGSLTGYAGGLAAKAWLLAHEAPARAAQAVAQ
ncbi:MAG: methylated-DNA--[protein]-cysteine S-methyltransferase [Myxococcota bacterium]